MNLGQMAGFSWWKRTFWDFQNVIFEWIYQEAMADKVNFVCETISLSKPTTVKFEVVLMQFCFSRIIEHKIEI